MVNECTYLLRRTVEFENRVYTESKCLNRTVLMYKLAPSLKGTGLSHISQGTLLARIFQFPINISERLILSLVGIFL
jgi:hypothetical protein